MRKTTKNELLTAKINKRGKPVYDVKANKITQADYATLVKRANERLRQLEKNNLTTDSKAYVVVKRYATSKPNGKGAIYTTSAEKGKPVKIRFKTKLSEAATQAERTYMINTVRNFLNAETSTMKGVKKIQKKSYEAFKKNMALINPELANISQKQYTRFWRTYRENVAQNDKDRYGYNTIVNLLYNTRVMSLNEEQIKKVITYMDNSRTGDDNFETIINNMPELRRSN